MQMALTSTSGWPRVLFENDAPNEPPSNETMIVTSPVASVLFYAPLDSTPISLAALDEPLNITLPFTATILRASWVQPAFTSSVCAWFDASAVVWRADGCRVANYSIAAGEFTCSCDRSGSFAVLTPYAYLGYTGQFACRISSHRCSLTSCSGLCRLCLERLG